MECVAEWHTSTPLPEAALPFFKGLDYYSRGDYAMAVPWFRDSCGKTNISTSPATGKRGLFREPECESGRQDMKLHSKRGQG